MPVSDDDLMGTPFLINETPGALTRGTPDLKYNY